MFQKAFFRFLLTAFLCHTGLAQATVVRLDITWGGAPAEAVYLELYDTETPVSVSNFLAYVETEGIRRYDGTFLHRSVPGFVIQGGGYAYDPDLGDFSVASAPHILQDAPIVNEFSPTRSNLRGTIAMAKLGGDPDSATSEWFLNLADNSANLDSQNGGFTVFGRVLGRGMEVFDAIESLDTVAAGGAFSNLPVDKANPSDPITASTLVVLERVVVNPPGRIQVDMVDLDFGTVAVNTSSDSQLISIQNIGGTPLTVGNIATLNSLEAPFLLLDDSCSGQTLAVTPSLNSSCQLTVQFQPTAPGEIQDSFDIPSNDTESPSVIVALSGFGAYSTPTLVADPASSVDFGNITVADFAEQQITVRNFGEGLLQLGLPAVSGANAADFTLVDDNNCLESTLDLSETCTFALRLDAGESVAGDQKSGLLTITAEPGSQAIELELSGIITESAADLLMPTARDGGDIVSFDIRFDEAFTTSVTFSNAGSEDLIFSAGAGAPAIAFSGTNASEFAISDSTCERVPPQGSCSATMTITPLAKGSLSATLRVLTNDPDTPEASLDFVITASSDGDGVPDSTEAAGPNAGDGNSDGIPDAEQDNVTSFLNAYDEYVTVESDIGTKLANVQSSENPSSGSLPSAVGASLRFPEGFFSFSIENVPVGGTATATLHIPQERANTYFKYNASRNIWYQFDYDPRSGIGAEINGNRITLHYVDGNSRGDNDGIANGVIVDPGGPGLVTASSNSSSGGGGCVILDRQHGRPSLPFDFILLLFGLLLFKGLRYRRPNH